MDALQARDRSSSTREFPRTIAELSPFTFGARNRFRMIVAAHALRQFVFVCIRQVAAQGAGNGFVCLGGGVGYESERNNDANGESHLAYREFG